MGKVIHIHVHKKATKDTLQGGSSKAAFSHNVKTEVAAGKPVKQAVAIAYSKQRETTDAPDDTSKGHWITINGAHVKVSEGGKITAGPEQLKQAIAHHQSQTRHHQEQAQKHKENYAKKSIHHGAMLAHHEAAGHLRSATEQPKGSYLQGVSAEKAEKAARGAFYLESNLPSKEPAKQKPVASGNEVKARQQEIKSIETEIMRIENNPDNVEGGAKAFHSGRQTTLKSAVKKKLDKLNKRLDDLLDQVEQH